ncbi:MAG: DUF4445 domain-containing protein [Methylococcaceae bacterium]|nr:DUF4445 domain-containing protein [Methylococcaceae bacterium]
MATSAECALTVCAADSRFVTRAAPGASLRDALLQERVFLRASCSGRGICGGCRVRVRSGSLSPATNAERTLLTAALLDDGWRLACQAKLVDDAELDCTDLAMSSGWTALGSAELPQRPLLKATAAVQGPPLGLAVDLGTTHIRVSLWDRRNGQRLSALTTRNPQSGYGSDVLSRLEAAAGGAAHQLSASVLAALGSALGDASALAFGAAAIDHVGRCVIVGNTAMLLLLTQNPSARLLDPVNWRNRISCQPPDGSEWRAPWGLPDRAVVEIAQPLSGFIGSDLLACVLVSRLMEHDVPALLIDVGTNTELALWDGNRLWVTSSPGGPAFEGVGISCGMAGDPGAVYRLQPGESGDELKAAVIGDRIAVGLCGSGLVDAVALLRARGVLRPSGRFNAAPRPGGYPLKLAGGSELSIEPGDIDAFQRGKAAIAASAQALLTEAGMRWEHLHKLHLCGVFGQHLQLDNARAVGLIPGLPDDRVAMHSHAALRGCEEALLERDGCRLLETVAERCRPLNPAHIEHFEDLFIDHLRLQPWPPSEVN